MKTLQFFSLFFLSLIMVSGARAQAVSFNDVVYCKGAISDGPRGVVVAILHDLETVPTLDLRGLGLDFEKPEVVEKKGTRTVYYSVDQIILVGPFQNMKADDGLAVRGVLSTTLGTISLVCLKMSQKAYLQFKKEKAKFPRHHHGVKREANSLPAHLQIQGEN
jgi:hypothetical protein